jgi:hypothetical protein
MKKLIIALVGALALLIPIATLANPTVSNEWTYFKTTPSGTRIYARTADINAGRPGDRAARLWTRQDSSRDRTVSYREARVLYSVNCVAESYTAVSYAFYKADGSVNSVRGDSSDTDFAVPGSIMADILGVLCSEPPEAEGTSY